MDVVKLLSLNEEKSHEKELGHITIQLFESDVKRGKKIGISEVEKARSSFPGFMKISWKTSHFQRETSLKVVTKNRGIILEASVQCVSSQSNIAGVGWKLRGCDLKSVDPFKSVGRKNI